MTSKSVRDGLARARKRLQQHRVTYANALQRPDDAIPLGRNPNSLAPVYLAASELDHHLHVMGGSQRGKTTSLTWLCKQLIDWRKQTGQGISIIDPHGELAENVLEVCAVEGVDPDDVVYVTLQEEDRVAVLNPLGVRGRPDFRADCFKETVLKSHGQARSQDTPGMNTTLAELGEALVRGNLTIVEAMYFVWQVGPERKAEFQGILDTLPPSDNRAYWQHIMSLPPAEKHGDLKGPANRLRGLVRPPVLRRMFGTTAGALDIQGIMDRGGIAIFNTSLEGAEIAPDMQDLINGLILQQYRQAFGYRTAKRKSSYDPKKTPPHTLIMDEFAGYCSLDFARTLTEASKFGLRCVFAHHSLKQLVGSDGDERLKDAVVAVPNKLIFGGIPMHEAELIAKHMFLADLNPDLIKHQDVNIHWDPVVERVINETQSGGASHTIAASDVDSEGAGVTIGVSTDPETGLPNVEHSGDSRQSSKARGTTIADSTQAGWSNSEAWQTFFERREQLGIPTYRHLDEQVFIAARTLHLNPAGVFVVGPEHRRPEMCNGKALPPELLSHQELVAYRDRVRANNFYRDAHQVDAEIEERQRRISGAAKPQEVLESVKPAPVPKRRKTRR